MKNAGLHRLFSTTSIIALIVVAWMLPLRIQQLVGHAEYAGSVSAVNVLIGIIVILAIILYILSLQRPVKEVIKEKVVEKTVTITEREAENKESEEEEGIDLKEIERAAKNIIPDQKKSKTTEEFTEKLLSNLAKEFEIVQGVVFIKEKSGEIFNPSGKYAYFLDEPPKSFKEGESIPGQVAKNQKLIVIDEIPEGYLKVISGLGDSHPRYLMIAPVMHKGECIAVIELASFKKTGKKAEATLEKVSELISNTIVELNKA
ncbi:MAG: GAF domain-containing protein [Bacteroidota bacterium]